MEFGTTPEGTSGVEWPAGARHHADFKLGQYVYYVPHNRFKAEGRYIVMRLLPQPKEPRYIIRSQAEPERDYTAEASELRRVPRGR
jgi:hypothetical protein